MCTLKTFRRTSTDCPRSERNAQRFGPSLPKNFMKLDEHDKEKLHAAMKKEWQSWLENRSRIIGSRWVLTWKKSGDPENAQVNPKAR